MPKKISEKLHHRIKNEWHESVIPTLMNYIRIPNKSPMFDPDWQQNGFMQKAVELFCDWADAHAVEGMELQIIQDDHRTPVIFIDIPGDSDKTVLLYGHLDKQPEMSGWRAGLGPWQPFLEDHKLFGRGAADDGYALFTALTAIRALREEKLSCPRCVIIIEASEESGSDDLPFYMNLLKQQIGTPSLVVGLDSGCGNYDQLWCTTSLRGLVLGDLTIETLTEGVHSGNAGGIAPSAFQVLRALLSRIEDENTGHIFHDAFKVNLPSQRLEQSQLTATILGKELIESYPLAKGVQAVSQSDEELILNRTWRSALAITGLDGFPATQNAGNVLLPKLKVRLSLRIPPILDVEKAAQDLKKILEMAPPHKALVKFELSHNAPGWNATELSSSLSSAIETASMNQFHKPAVYMGEGGSIPFMHMLGQQYPKAQFLITGVLGPHSNAHGPNEFLHIPYAIKLTAAIAEILHASA